MSVGSAPDFAVEIHDLTHVFDDPAAGGDVTALRDITLHVSEGEFVSLLGPSGCGKSTILNLIAGFLLPTRGVVKVQGKAVIGPGPDRGVCFQEAALFPWLCILDNVLFGPRAQKRDVSPEQAVDLLQRLGLAAFRAHYPHQLSGGMKQRAAIARLLINDPPILLMDEPFAALDALTRLQVQDHLLNIHEEFRRTVVFVTHDIDEAVYTSDRIVMMSARPGRIVDEIIVDEPRPRRREFITSAHFIDYKKAALSMLSHEA